MNMFPCIHARAPSHEHIPHTRTPRSRPQRVLARLRATPPHPPRRPPRAPRRWRAAEAPARPQVVQEGIIPPLVAMLRAFEENLQMLAAACVRNIALDATNKVALVESGVLPPLVALLSSINVGVQEQVRRAARTRALVLPARASTPIPPPPPLYLSLYLSLSPLHTHTHNVQEQVCRATCARALSRPPTRAIARETIESTRRPGAGFPRRPRRSRAGHRALVTHTASGHSRVLACPSLARLIHTHDAHADTGVF
jgi:hypothetical protein